MLEMEVQLPWKFTFDLTKKCDVFPSYAKCKLTEQLTDKIYKGSVN